MANKPKKIVNCFFAFPGYPEDRKQIINKAIDMVNAQKLPRIDYRVISWTKMKSKSSRLISTILDCIYNSEIVIADISDLNTNVLFELGFAFGSGKKLILYTQGFSKKQKSADLNDLEIIKGFKINRYENSNQLAKDIVALLKEKESSVPEISRYQILDNNANLLFYLKGNTNHAYAVKLESCFKTLNIEHKIDDWTEYQSQSLGFYIQGISASDLVCALFVDASWDDARRINARFSFICGMAVAFKKRVMMIGLPGFELPFDYNELLVIPENEDIIETKFLELFLSEKPTVEFLVPNYNNDFELKKISDTRPKSVSSSPSSTKTVLSKQEKELVLLYLNLGNPVAENEEKHLPDYFIETGQYRQAMISNQGLIVGNKGSGKTAIFYCVRNDVRGENAQNLICEIKPSDYKLERFMDILKALEEHKGFQGHVLENVWKTIAYCNILESLDDQLNKKTLVPRTAAEQALVSFVDRYKTIIKSSFDQKLQLVCDYLNEVDNDPYNFSEKIHREFLNEAKSVLSPLLRLKNKVLILVDNLDKAWDVNNDLSLQALIVYNLMGVHRRLQSDFNIDGIAVLIFLRRNIYEFMISDSRTREADKLAYETIELLWDNSELFFRVLVQRFFIAAQKMGYEGEFSIDSFFNLKKIHSLNDWLYQNLLPRPRDLISFIEKAIGKAIDNNHSEIYDEDLNNALVDYSNNALTQIVAEYKAEYSWIENLTYSFTGECKTFTHKELVRKIKSQFREDSQEQILNKILVLVNMVFLGVSINSAPIVYTHRIADFTRIKSVIITKNGNEIVYTVNPIFYRCLSISENERGKPQKSFIKTLADFLSS